MKTRHLVQLLLLTSLTAWAAPPAFPKDVQAFLDRRESCDHWRGEDGYDEERQKDINWAVCQSCTGTDVELARLKSKYRRDALVAKALADFEPRIEPRDKVAAARFCKAARKPVEEQ
jgi:hypothetical protein